MFYLDLVFPLDFREGKIERAFPANDTLIKSWCNFPILNALLGKVHMFILSTATKLWENSLRDEKLIETEIKKDTELQWKQHYTSDVIWGGKGSMAPLPNRFTA